LENTLLSIACVSVSVIIMAIYKCRFISHKSTSALDIATIKMKNDADIPCSKCPFWNQEKKSFSCDPNRCERLSRWLLKHSRDTTFDSLNKNVQYVV